jgi:hypothetical protein
MFHLPSVLVAVDNKFRVHDDRGIAASGPRHGPNVGRAGPNLEPQRRRKREAGVRVRAISRIVNGRPGLAC